MENSGLINLSEELYEGDLLDKARVTLKGYKKIIEAELKEAYKRQQGRAQRAMRETKYPGTLFIGTFWAMGIPIIETTVYLVSGEFLFPKGYEPVFATMLGALGYDLAFNHLDKKG